MADYSDSELLKLYNKASVHNNTAMTPCHCEDEDYMENKDIQDQQDLEDELHKKAVRHSRCQVQIACNCTLKRVFQNGIL